MQYLSFMVGGKRSPHGASWEVVCAFLKFTHHPALAPKVNALLEHRSEKTRQSFTQEKALLIELLINKRLVNKFPVVCLLGGVLLHIPALLGGFLGCSATPDLKERLLLSVTLEIWHSSLPPCKNFFLSRAPAQCCKLPLEFAGFLLPLPACCGPLAASHTCMSSDAPSIFSFSGKGYILFPEYINRKVSKEFYLCSSVFFRSYGI